jgi:hypothetical protein
MNYDLLTKARQVLEPLWRAAWLKGRCWGPKSEKNPYSATNIIFCIGSELVSISQSNEGLVIHEFQRTTDTKLGERVKDLFQRAGLMPVEIKEVISPRGYTWYCTVCRKRGEIDPGRLVEVDSRGEGARDLVRKIDKEHARVSPMCHNPHIEVLDENLVKQEKITDLLSLKRVK